MEIKTTLALVGLAISTLSFLYYMYTVYWGQTRPHLYSWLIWGLVTGIACAAQFSADAGPGAWITLLATIFCMLRVLAALTHGVKEFTHSDKWCLAACLLAIVAWQAVGEPLIAVIIVSFIDVAGFYPTLRNAWHRPYEDNPISHFLYATVYALSLAGLDVYTFTTALYPATVCLACLGMMATLYWRRRVIHRA